LAGASGSPQAQGHHGSQPVITALRAVGSRGPESLGLGLVLVLVGADDAVDDLGWMGEASK